MTRNNIAELRKNYVQFNSIDYLNFTHRTKAFIDGRDISLETHQTELWKRYTEKYENEK